MVDIVMGYDNAKPIQSLPKPEFGMGLSSRLNTTIMSDHLSFPLPFELLHCICSFIDEPADLLAFALTSKAVKGVVLPLHLELRWIRCDLKAVEVWKYLASNPTTASGVRYLEILPIKSPYILHSDIVYPGPLVPRALRKTCGQENVDDDLDRANTCLLRAIRLLSLLKGFKWMSFTQLPLELLNALSFCENLREVEVLNWNEGEEGTLSLNEGAKLCQSEFWKLSNLSKFNYSENLTHKDQDVYLEYVTQMAEMLLHRCSGLQDLQLFFAYDFFSDLPFAEIIQDLFRDAHWPNLRRLNIEGRMISRYGVSSKFFAAHPELHALRITDGAAWDIDLFELPPIHSLDLDWIPSFDDLQPSFFQTIRHLSLEVLEGFSDIEALHEVKSLESLVLRTPEPAPPLGSITYIVRCVPSIKRFALIRIRYTSNFSTSKGEELSHFSAMLTSLPNLTHFSPAYLQLWAPEGQDGPPQETTAQINRALRAILTFAPKLLYVNLISDSREDPSVEPRVPRWVSIQRDEGGTYSGYVGVTNHHLRKEIDIDLWGDVNWGAGREFFC